MNGKAEKFARKTKKRKSGYYVRIAVCFLVIAGFLYTLISQQLRLISIRRETVGCKKEITAMEKEYDVLKEKEKYNSSDEFYEDKARDEGYVRDNETVFIIEN